MNTYRAGTETLPEHPSSHFPFFFLQFLKAHNISLQELHTLPGHKNSLTASLYCLSFFYLQFRIAPLISSNCSCSHIYRNIFLFLLYCQSSVLCIVFILNCFFTSIIYMQIYITVKDLTGNKFVSI